ncbi:hypothetical protein J1N35_021474 [Gossypium stocksii]|uniref:Uncharacterized protein n=1 Tax=Gossypium stocksii TaxID=47602 RepID=A0A9D4A1C3_9ROSI|nr:hypothetical protein J1N35_021474 [Gossypium stocksii]
MMLSVARKGLKHISRISRSLESSPSRRVGNFRRRRRHLRYLKLELGSEIAITAQVEVLHLGAFSLHSFEYHLSQQKRDGHRRCLSFLCSSIKPLWIALVIPPFL